MNSFFSVKRQVKRLANVFINTLYIRAKKSLAINRNVTISIDFNGYFIINQAIDYLSKDNFLVSHSQ